MCGKEIGPLRLLRDDEFCSSAHRNRYKERLGKALHSISAPEPAPAGIAGFRTDLRPHSGKVSFSAALRGFDPQPHAIQFRLLCPVTVDAVFGNSFKTTAGAAVSNLLAGAQTSVDPLDAMVLRVPELRLAIAPDAPASAQPVPAAAPAKRSRRAKEPIPAASGPVPLPPDGVESLLTPSTALLHLVAPFVIQIAAQTPPAIRASLAAPAAEDWAALPAEAVESLLAWATDLRHMEAPAAALRMAAQAPPAVGASLAMPASENWAVLPAEAVESLLAWATDLRHMEAPAAAVRMAAEMPPAAGAGMTLWASEKWANLPAEAVERMLAPVSVLEPLSVALAPALPQLAAAAAALQTSLAGLAPSAQPGEAASYIQNSSAPSIASADGTVAPRFDLPLATEAPAPPAEEPVEVVAACEEWMPAPGAEAVTSRVQWSAAEVALWNDLLAAAPLQLGLAVTETFLPQWNKLVKPPAPEPAAVHVFAMDAAQPMVAPAIRLRGTDPIFDLALDAASYVEGPHPAPVESMPAAHTVQPAEVAIESVMALAGTPLPAASCSHGHSPAVLRPVAVESLVVSGFRADMMVTARLSLPALELASAGSRPAALELSTDSSTLPQPKVLPAASRPAALEPIRKLALVPPLNPVAARLLTVPEQGFLHLEFYCHRPLANMSRNLEWMAPASALIQPPFAMRPIFGKVEDTAPQKKAAKIPAMAEIFALPEAKRKAANPAVHYAMKAIAASVVMGGVLWFGVGAMRIGNHNPAVNRDVSMIDAASEDTSDVSTPAAPSGPAATTVAARTEPHGAVARLRKAISERAAATVTDSFRNGMEAWGTKPKAWAAGWSRHPEGYVQPGQLALFRPSVNYRDYHLEFFGQIDSKSMGWTVRSKDPKNYYAMKFTVIEPGLRPIIAMVHYPVVGGRKGRQSQTPLNVMVHNNTPFQVAVDVKGNRMVTSIDGQEVDTWIDDSLPAGGVGFFADAGEKARLYWMKVSKNEDFLGRICAYVSSKLGDGSNVSAEVWPSEMPGRAPAPGPRLPGCAEEATLAAAMVGMGRRKERWMAQRVSSDTTLSRHYAPASREYAPPSRDREGAVLAASGRDIRFSTGRTDIWSS